MEYACNDKHSVSISLKFRHPIIGSTLMLETSITTNNNYNRNKNCQVRTRSNTENSVTNVNNNYILIRLTMLCVYDDENHDEVEH